MIDVQKSHDLPDSSFAYIEPGGVRDAVGKTAPNVLRHLPYKDADGVVDLESLAAALNAVKDTNLPAKTQDRVRAKLEAVATKFARAEGVEKYITHEHGKWLVHAESGKVLGTHSSHADAAAQLGAIEAHKHPKSKAELLDKKDAEYRMTKDGEEQIQCHTCKHYTANSDDAKPRKPGDPAGLGTCDMVAGEIEPDATCKYYDSAVAKDVHWPVDSSRFRGSSLTDAGEKAPNQKDADGAPEWADEAKGSVKEAEAHGFTQDLKTGAGVRMSHPGGTSLFVNPAGKWSHNDKLGEKIGTGSGPSALGEHLGRQADHFGALPHTVDPNESPFPKVPVDPNAPPKPKPGEKKPDDKKTPPTVEVNVHGQPKKDDAMGKDADFEREYEDFKQRVADAVKKKAGPGSRVQTLIFDKDKYKKANEAKQWASDHGFKAEKVDESADSWRVRQEDPGAFARMRTISLTEGVQAVVGFPKKTVKALQDAFFVTASGRLAFKSADIEKTEFEAYAETPEATIFRVKCAGHTLYFAASGDTAVYMPAYQELAKSAWVHVVKSEEQRYTLTVVYPASKRSKPEPDFHGDVMSEEELEKSAWGFMEKGTDRIGLMHRPGTAGAGKVVESYIWRAPEWKIKDAGGMDQSVSPGDWVMGIVWSPEAWKAIKAGHITGVSLQGAARKEAF